MNLRRVLMCVSMAAAGVATNARAQCEGWLPGEGVPGDRKSVV